VVAYLIGFHAYRRRDDADQLHADDDRLPPEQRRALPSDDALVAALAIGGIAFIVGGTVVYVLGTRFRGQGMGKSQDDSDES